MFHKYFNWFDEEKCQISFYITRSSATSHIISKIEVTSTSTFIVTTTKRLQWLALFVLQMAKKLE